MNIPHELRDQFRRVHSERFCFVNDMDIDDSLTAQDRRRIRRRRERMGVSVTRVNARATLSILGAEVDESDAHFTVCMDDVTICVPKDASELSTFDTINSERITIVALEQWMDS